MKITHRIVCILLCLSIIPQTNAGITNNLGFSGTEKDTLSPRILTGTPEITHSFSQLIARRWIAFVLNFLHYKKIRKKISAAAAKIKGNAKKEYQLPPTYNRNNFETILGTENGKAFYDSMDKLLRAVNTPVHHCGKTYTHTLTQQQKDSIAGKMLYLAGKDFQGTMLTLEKLQSLIEHYHSDASAFEYDVNIFYARVGEEGPFQEERTSEFYEPFHLILDIITLTEQSLESLNDMIDYIDTAIKLKKVGNAMIVANTAWPLASQSNTPAHVLLPHLLHIAIICASSTEAGIIVENRIRKILTTPFITWSTPFAPLVTKFQETLLNRRMLSAIQSAI